MQNCAFCWFLLHRYISFFSPNKFRLLLRTSSGWNFNWNYNNLLHCYRLTATQLKAFVPLCSCNNSTLKTAAIAAETCWWEKCDLNTPLNSEVNFVGLFVYYEHFRLFFVMVLWNTERVTIRGEGGQKYAITRGPGRRGAEFCTVTSNNCGSSLFLGLAACSPSGA